MNDEYLIWEAYQNSYDESILGGVDFDTLVDIAKAINKRLNYKWLGLPNDNTYDGESAVLSKHDEETLKKEIEALYKHENLIKMLDEVITSVLNK